MSEKTSYTGCWCYKCNLMVESVSNEGPDCGCDFPSPDPKDFNCQECPKRTFCDVALHPEDYDVPEGKLPQIDTPIQKTLAEIQEIEGALNLITTRVRALIPLEDCKVMTFNELTQLLETRRHRIMEQLKTPFDPKECAKLESEPGIENRNAPGK